MDKKIMIAGSLLEVFILVNISFASAVNTVINVEKMEGNKNEKQSNYILENIQVNIDGPLLLLVGKEYTFTCSYYVFYGFNAFFEVDWGDGTTPYGAYHVEGKEFYLKHTYNKTGRYTIKATASYPEHPDGPYGEGYDFPIVLTESQYPIWEILFKIIGGILSVIIVLLFFLLCLLGVIPIA